MWSSLTWPYLTHGLTSLRGILSIGARFLLENSIKAKGLWPCLVAPCVWLPEATIYFHKSFTFGQLGWDCLALYGEWRREWNFYNLSLTWQYKDIKASLVQIDGVGGRDAGWRSSAGPAHLLVSLDVQSRRACVRRAKTTMVGLGRGELVDAGGPLVARVQRLWPRLQIRYFGSASSPESSVCSAAAAGLPLIHLIIPSYIRGGEVGLCNNICHFIEADFQYVLSIFFFVL